MKWFTDYFYYVEIIGSRYFIIAGLAFLLFYVLLLKKIGGKKIQRRQPKRKDYLREIGYSIITISIFAFVPLAILHVPAIARTTTFYTDIQQHGWLYFYLAFPIL